MRRIYCDAPINLIAGILALTPEQAAARAHCLTDLGEGLYQIEKPVQFKRGEKLGYDGDLISKELAAAVSTENQPVDGDQPKPKRGKRGEN